MICMPYNVAVLLLLLLIMMMMMMESSICWQQSLLDPLNPGVKISICQSLSEVDCSRWRQCCAAGIQCCRQQMRRLRRYHGNRTITPHHDDADESTRCGMTWDGYTCWPDIPSGYRQTQACPAYMSLIWSTSQLFVWKGRRQIISKGSASLSWIHAACTTFQ